MTTPTTIPADQGAVSGCAVCAKLDELQAKHGKPGRTYNGSGLADVRVLRKRHAESGTCLLGGGHGAA
ncbi:hypothetical protein ACFVXH_03230 [Kitasatospora sp. NPDC058184]|uniref:hypothetical protein n=1 Tax=Kitasatospora sp. NPDC058184 TaxID=3346370 RepID=UPI0036DD9BB7